MTPTAELEQRREAFPWAAGPYRFRPDQFDRLAVAGIAGPGDPAENRRWSVAEYHRMIRLGILTEDDRVELLDGWLVRKMGQNSPHSSVVDRLTEDLIRVVPPGWRVRIQLPVTLAGGEPEPDAAVVRGDRRAFDHRHPGPGDFGIVVEVSDSTLADDRRKARLYAGAGVPVYWIVNLDDRVIEVYSDPDPAADPPAYRTRVDYRPGQDVPITLDGRAAGAIPAADLLP